MESGFMGHELSIAVIHGAGGTKKRDAAVAIETTPLLTHARSTAIRERKQPGQTTNPHIWSGFC